MYFVLPLLSLLINSYLLYHVTGLLIAYFEFEYLVMALFFLFFVMVATNAIFKSIFSFITKKYTFNLLFLVQFLSSLLILQLLGWVFTLYLTFVMLLLYLLFTRQSILFMIMLEVCGIVVGGIFLIILVFQL